MELETPKFCQFPSQVQTIDQLSTSLLVLTSVLLTLLILTCEALPCFPSFYIDMKLIYPRNLCLIPET